MSVFGQLQRSKKSDWDTSGFTLWIPSRQDLVVQSITGTKKHLIVSTGPFSFLYFCRRTGCNIISLMWHVIVIIVHIVYTIFQGKHSFFYVDNWCVIIRYSRDWMVYPKWCLNRLLVFVVCLFKDLHTRYNSGNVCFFVWSKFKPWKENK